MELHAPGYGLLTFVNSCNQALDPGGGTPYNGLYGKASPKRGTLFRLQVYERVGILLVKVYERVCERAQRA